MENKILEYHLILTNIYNEAEKTLELIHKKAMKATLNSYKDHYIKINGQYVCQKYYMPVISIENKGDICFNLNGIEFEYYVSKESLLKNKKLDQILENYRNELNIYEFKDCTKDIYDFKDSK